MRVSESLRSLVSGLVILTACSAQVIDFESNGLRYHALTRSGFTIMVAPLPSHVRDFSVVQIAISNGGKTPVTIKPEDFVFRREDGTDMAASSAREVVRALIERASRGDVVKLLTSYENSIYGNALYKATNGYEQRRQNAFTEFTSTRVRAAAAASAIAFVQTKVGPGQSTDGAIFYPSAGKPLGNGSIRVQAGGQLYEFPLVLLEQSRLTP